MRRAAFILAALLLLAHGGAAWAASAASQTAAQNAANEAANASGAHAGHPAQDAHAGHPPAPAPVPATTPAGKAGPAATSAPPLPSNPASGVTEKIGQMAALDVELLAEDGSRVRLADLVDKPTLLAPVYYSCPNECNVLLGTLATVLPQVGLTPGVDYQVLAVSFDDRDTPATATKRKGDFFNAGAAGFPPQAWRFLSGDEASVRRLMNSVGFGYQRAGDAFQHSIALIVLTPSGKISRYLYGIRPLAFDIALAATEAGAEKTGLSIKRAIAMCYTYDPQGRRYVFDFMKVTGVGVLAALGIFGLFLAFGGKKRAAPKKPQD